MPLHRQATPPPKGHQAGGPAVTGARASPPSAPASTACGSGARKIGRDRQAPAGSRSRSLLPPPINGPADELTGGRWPLRIGDRPGALTAAAATAASTKRFPRRPAPPGSSGDSGRRSSRRSPKPARLQLPTRPSQLLAGCRRRAAWELSDARGVPDRVHELVHASQVTPPARRSARPRRVAALAARGSAYVRPSNGRTFVIGNTVARSVRTTKGCARRQWSSGQPRLQFAADPTSAAGLLVPQWSAACCLRPPTVSGAPRRPSRF